jgi:hypothetical protein
MTNLTIHEFTLGDVDDPEVYAALPLMKFLETEKGIWCKTHSETEMTYEVLPDIISFGYRVTVHAKFNPEDLMMYHLKYSHI